MSFLNVKKPKTTVGIGIVFILFGIVELVFNQADGSSKIIFMVALVIPGLIFLVAGIRALSRGDRS